MNQSVPTPRPGSNPVQSANQPSNVTQQQTAAQPQRSIVQTTTAQPELTTEMFHRILGHMLAVDPKVSDLIFSPGRPPQVELTSDLFGGKTNAGPY